MDIWAILYPLEWLVANIMVIWHWAFSALGMDPDSGLIWVLAIVGLTVTIRAALIPLFVKQIRASRQMQIIAPELRKVQDKYKGKKDQASREAMSRETMELYSKHKTNPFASCLPILVQMPIFFSLFRVLNYRLEGDQGPIGLLNEQLLESAQNATIFGASLGDSFNNGDVTVKILAGVLIALMVATQFFTQRQLTMKNMPASALEGPMAQQQKMLMYGLPFIFVFSGPWFPIGVLIYWTTTNLWTMGQQFYVISRTPAPGSEAERRRNERLKARGKLKEEEPVAGLIEDKPKSGQRQQPKRKNRGGSKPAKTQAESDSDSTSESDDK